MIRIACVLALAMGCSSSSDCSTNEVKVSYLGGGTLDGESECKPIPASCGATASCSDMTCESDLYALCESPYIGVGCSDTFPPTIISCNP